jgi:hypothetical protein
MIRYIIGTLLGIAGIVASLYFFVGVPRVYDDTYQGTRTPHIYDDPDQAIERIHITALYFVPTDRVLAQRTNWRTILEEKLTELADFHTRQFAYTSSISFEILPEPVYGLQESGAYGTDAIHFGNPSEMKRIITELRPTMQKVGGAPEAYEVIVVMYEGIGAASTENISLISRQFLTELPYAEFGTTYLAHEFYHSLRVPEGYAEAYVSFENNQKNRIEVLSSSDVMGRIQVPITNTYLSRDSLSRMGM